MTSGSGKADSSSINRRIATKPHQRANESRCFCDQCEGLMAEGLVYGPDDGFLGWGAE
jgi:hypothetical protein